MNYTISSNTSSLGFLRSGSILNGILPAEEHIILDEAGSPYKSDGSLIIDGYLDILPNVTIQMSAGSNLVVRKGGIRARGTFDMPITLDKLSPSEAWGGLAIEKKNKCCSWLSNAPGIQ